MILSIRNNFQVGVSLWDEAQQNHDIKLSNHGCSDACSGLQGHRRRCRVQSPFAQSWWPASQGRCSPCLHTGRDRAKAASDGPSVVSVRGTPPSTVVRTCQRTEPAPRVFPAQRHRGRNRGGTVCGHVGRSSRQAGPELAEAVPQRDLGTFRSCPGHCCLFGWRTMSTCSVVTSCGQTSGHEVGGKVQDSVIHGRSAPGP